MNDLLEQFKIDSSEYESLISESSYIDFCNNMDDLKLFLYEAIEDDVNKRSTSNGKRLSTVKNTMDTFRNIKNVHSNITDAGGSMIKFHFDLFMKGLSLLARIIKFLTNNMIKLEENIGNSIRYVSSIPHAAIRKIKGDIGIYLTPSDVEDIYSTNIMKYINEFMIAADNFSKGNLWTTFLGKEINGKFSISNIDRNDKKSYKIMNKYYATLKKVKINKTDISLSNTKMVDVYFGNSKAVSFIDINGKPHEVTYLESLLILVKDLEKYQKVLKGLNNQIANKINRTKINGKYNKLPSDMRQQITNSMVMMSGVVSLVGDIIKYTIQDINTINSATKTILLKYGINVKNKK